MKYIETWNKLKDSDKLDIFNEVSARKNLKPAVVEKDWWVSLTLRIIFNMEIAPNLVFKGGTSLSKAWKLISRFSEDIDLALDRKFFDFEGNLTRGEIRKLRKKSYRYIAEVFVNDLEEEFKSLGIEIDEIKTQDDVPSDQDPLIIEIYYPTITERLDYIEPRVLVEIGSRSLREPFTIKEISSMVGEEYKERDFADPVIEIPCVNPERTFLEKIFLLHEEFQKPTEKIRVDRLSRHLYDIQKIMSTKYADIAFEDMNLYETIIKHRKVFTRISNIDYDLHKPGTINLVPPDAVFDKWKNDYEDMRSDMLPGDPLAFDDLMEEIKILQDRINNLNS